MAGSAFKVKDAGDSTNLVPQSTPYQDANGNPVLLKTVGYVANGIVQPVDATHPLPVAFGGSGFVLGAGTAQIGAVAQAGAPWSVSWTGQTVAATQSGTWNVAVSNFPATQPVSGTISVGNFPATQPVSATSLPLPTGAATAANQQPFLPIAGATVALTVGPTATTAPVALPAHAAAVYRIHNAAASASPVAWRLQTATPGTAPVMPTAYSTAGTGGTVGDKTIDPGGIEIFALAADQQTAIAAGTLYLSAVTPAGGSAAIYVTPGAAGL